MLSFICSCSCFLSSFFGTAASLLDAVFMLEFLISFLLSYFALPVSYARRSFITHLKRAEESHGPLVPFVLSLHPIRPIDESTRTYHLQILCGAKKMGRFFYVMPGSVTAVAMPETLNFPVSCTLCRTICGLWVYPRLLLSFSLRTVLSGTYKHVMIYSVGAPFSRVLHSIVIDC